MSWVKFSVAVVLTSAALVVALFATGAMVVGNALASTLPGMAGQTHMMGQLPPELSGLRDIPQGERFAHFKGIQASLTDKDGKPITIAVTPGVVTSSSASSLTIAGNDGASHTYAVDAQTLERGKAVTNGEDVVVVSMNGSADARAVFGATPGRWHHGP